MTRATLLRLLAHPTALNGADVRALEELADAFPYCQTAHLLLAKAAHDQGSMLASQRLRRAATYAADRTLLRQLIETTAEEETLAPTMAEAMASEAAPGEGSAADNWYPSAPAAAVSLPAEPIPPRPAPLLEDQPAQEIEHAPLPAPSSISIPVAPTLPPTAATAPADHPPTYAAEVAEPSTQPAFNSDSGVATAPTEEAAAEAAVVAPEEVAPTITPELSAESATSEATEAPAVTDNAAATSPLPQATQEDTAPTEIAELPSLADSIEVAEPLATVADLEAAPAENQPDSAPAPFAPETETIDFLGAEAAAELPAQAPPIRPPAEAEAASQEFGLASAEPAEVAAYKLPELELAITVPLTLANATPRLPPFSGVADVAYAPGEGSRYGFCLVPASTTDSTQLVPATSLPPTGDFFVPDALVLAHVAEQPELPASSTNDLINSFLQRSPAATRRRVQASAPGVQADLSIRSTRVAPDLASESLALILVRQGKIEQAIVVYERLLVKNPEKSAYFAAQIDILRPLA